MIKMQYNIFAPHLVTSTVSTSLSPTEWGILTDEVVKHMLEFSRVLNPPSGGSNVMSPNTSELNDERCIYCGCKTYKKDISCSMCGAPI
jgi:hypothetical protein